MSINIFQATFIFFLCFIRTSFELDEDQWGRIRRHEAKNPEIYEECDGDGSEISCFGLHWDKSRCLENKDCPMIVHITHSDDNQDLIVKMNRIIITETVIEGRKFGRYRRRRNRLKREEDSKRLPIDAGGAEETEIDGQTKEEETVSTGEEEEEEASEEFAETEGDLTYIWLAVGFSRSGTMADSLVLDCIKEGEKTRATFSYNYDGRKNMEIEGNGGQTEASYEDALLECSWTLAAKGNLKIGNGKSSFEYDTQSEIYNILMAAGLMRKGTEKQREVGANGKRKHIWTHNFGSESLPSYREEARDRDSAARISTCTFWIILLVLFISLNV